MGSFGALILISKMDVQDHLHLLVPPSERVLEISFM